MPQVPRYETQVRTEALPGARLSGVDADAFGAGLGRGMQQLGGEIAQYAAQERQKKIETDVADRLNKLDAWSNRTTIEARDPANGIKGESAKDDVSRYSDSFGRAVEQASSDLTDPEAKRVFTMRAAQRRNAFNETLMSHADKVVFGYQNDQDTQTMRLADERAGLHYDDPNQVASARQDKQDAFARMAQRNNWSPERSQAEWQQATSGMHMEILRGYLNADRLGDASEYLKHVDPAEMTAKDRETAHKVVGVASDSQQAQSIADQAHAQVVAGTLKPTEVEDWIKKQAGDNVRQRDDARSRYDRLNASRQKAINEEVGNAVDQAYQILQSTNGDKDAVLRSPELMASLTKYAPEKIHAIEKVAENWKAKEQTDPMAILSLKGTDPEAIAKMDPVEFFNQFHDKFSESDWKMASNYWAECKQAQTNATKKADLNTQYQGSRTKIQMIQDSLVAAGYSKDALDASKYKPGSQAAKNAAAMANVLDRAIAAREYELAQKNGGKPVSLGPNEILKEISGVFLRMGAKPADEWGDGLNDGDIYLPPNAEAISKNAISDSEVPAGDRANITDAIRQKWKREPVPGEIVREYNRTRSK